MKVVLSVNSARLILLAGILSIAVCCTANATLIVTDNFNDNATSSSLWSLGIVGVGPSIQERNGRLEFVIPGNSQPGPTGMGAYYMTKGLYGGDFDARVDFELVNWPPANGVRVGLSIGNWQNVERDSVVYAGDGRNAYVMSLWPGLAIRDTTDQSGTLRMVRSGSTITGYFWDTSLGDWSQIASSVYPAGDKYFVLAVWSDESLFADKDVAVALDNFAVYDSEGGPPVPPVPDSSSSVALFALSSLALLVSRWSLELGRRRNLS